MVAARSSSTCSTPTGSRALVVRLGMDSTSTAVAPTPRSVDYRCTGCRRVFNLFTGTLWHGTHLSPGQILLILRGIAQGVPAAKLAREVGISRQHLLRLRHEIPARALAAADRSPRPDDQTEADELYQNAGENRGAAHRPRRPAAAVCEPGQGPRHLGD